MPVAEARVPTERPSRYLVQLCKHAGQMGSHMRHGPRLHRNGEAPPEIKNVEWSDTHGTIDVGWGRCTLEAGPDALTLRMEAADADGLERFQALIAGRLERIGRRDALHVTWRWTEALDHGDGPATKDAGPAAETATRRRYGGTIGLTAVIALVVTVHLGLGGSLLAGSWTGWGIGAVAAVILVKCAVVLGGLAVRRRKASAGR
ncbi:DUF2218 domain-containing protein [Streptomyces sp. NPDC059718]